MIYHGVVLVALLVYIHIHEQVDLFMLIRGHTPIQKITVVMVPRLDAGVQNEHSHHENSISKSC